jgi:post-segregation antitoxin (ccd killing protein)
MRKKKKRHVVEDFYQTACEHRKKNQNISTQVETKISNKSNNKEKQQWLKR